MVALGVPEAVGHPEDPVYDNQDRLTALTKEIQDLHQRVAAGEGQPADPGSHTVWTSKFDACHSSATATCTC